MDERIVSIFEKIQKKNPEAVELTFSWHDANDVPVKTSISAADLYEDWSTECNNCPSNEESLLELTVDGCSVPEEVLETMVFVDLIGLIEDTWNI